MTKKPILVILLIVLLGSHGHAQGTATAVTLGLFMDRLMDQVQSAIIAARNSSDTVAMETARQAAIIIQSAKNAYSDALNQTFDQLNPTITGTLNQLKAAADDVTNKATGSVSDFAKRLQQVANTLPFRNGEPQLTDVLPSFVVPAKTDYPVVIRLRGNFVFAGRKKFSTSLTINGTVLPPSQVKTQELQFTVPVSELFPIAKTTEPYKFQFASATLSVPWETSSDLGVIKHRRVDQYAVSIGALPLYPGTFKIEDTLESKVPSPNNKRLIDQERHQCSTKECGNNDDIDHPYSLTPEQDCHIVRGTGRIDFRQKDGESSSTFVSDDQDVLRWNVTTIHKTAGSSGDVNFTIGFDEKCDETRIDTQTTSFELSWGDSKQYGSDVIRPNSRWKLIFEGFDKSHVENNATSEHPFFMMSVSINSVTIAAKDPASVSWP